MKVEVKKDIFKRARNVPSNKMVKGVFKWTAKYRDEFMACLAIFTFSDKDITEHPLCFRLKPRTSNYFLSY